MTTQPIHPRRLAGRAAQSGVAFALAALTGCGSIAQRDAAADRAVPGADAGFPTLGSVPPRPSAPTPAAERERLLETLLADRALAQARRRSPHPGPR